MRSEGYGGVLTLLCDHCGEAIRVVKPVNERPVVYETKELTSAEVWFSPPGGRGGIRWQVEGDLYEEKRVTIFDSCNKCAAEAMEMIENFYPEPEENA